MSLPRLRAKLVAPRAVASVLRAAIRHEVKAVPLVEAPRSMGQHILEIIVDGEGEPVTLLAQPAGVATQAGLPLDLKPLSRAHMATLFALVERIDDEPSRTIPPESGPMLDEVSESDNTLLDHLSDMPLPMPAPTEGMLLGRLIAGKYRIEQLIGSGASAAVYRATHADLRRKVAVKILHAQMRTNPQFVARFRAEALAASTLQHLNVTRVLDFGQEADGLLYLVMEFLEGRSLQAYLEECGGHIPQKKAIALAIQACSALAFAHDVGIIHRDVKPENLMLVPHRDDDGNPCDLVKVCDFGLAKLRDADAELADLTGVGMLCGSPAYMSPEQSRGEALDLRSDVYALGITLFECLTGGFPHEANELTELFTKKSLEAPRRAASMNPEIDPRLDDVIARAIATDPGSRHATARILREELRRVLEALEEESDDDREPTIIAD